jgi:hypothetical protein
MLPPQCRPRTSYPCIFRPPHESAVHTMYYRVNESLSRDGDGARFSLGLIRGVDKHSSDCQCESYLIVNVSHIWLSMWVKFKPTEYNLKPYLSCRQVLISPLTDSSQFTIVFCDWASKHSKLLPQLADVLKTIICTPGWMSQGKLARGELSGDKMFAKANCPGAKCPGASWLNPVSNSIDNNSYTHIIHLKHTVL